MALRGHYKTTSWYQLKAITHLSGQSVREFASVTELLAHQALVGLLKDFIHSEVAHAFVDGVKDQE
jgi:hypothetical protein